MREEQLGKDSCERDWGADTEWLNLSKKLACCPLFLPWFSKTAGTSQRKVVSLSSSKLAATFLGSSSDTSFWKWWNIKSELRGRGGAVLHFKNRQPPSSFFIGNHPSKQGPCVSSRGQPCTLQPHSSDGQRGRCRSSTPRLPQTSLTGSQLHFYNNWSSLLTGRHGGTYTTPFYKWRGQD